MENIDGMNSVTKNVNVSVLLSGSLNKADECFLKFLQKVEYPITREQIYDWYEKKVKRYGDYETYFSEYQDKKITVLRIEESTKRARSMAWFDRRLGKLIRIGFFKLTIPKVENIEENLIK